MILAFPAKPKRPWPLLCSLTRLGAASRRIFRRRLGPRGRQSWERFPMLSMFNHKGHEGTRRGNKTLRGTLWPLWLNALLLLSCISCGKHAGPSTLVMIIESSPTNLDPRVGTDAQSERIDELIFDPLVHRDDHFNMVPWVAEKWEIPDPQTYIFHLRQGIRFHDGRPLTSRDIKWTLDSVRDGSLITLKTTTYKLVDHVDVPNESTLIIHLSAPDGTLLYNVSDGAFGIVPYGSDKQFSRNPIGSGPFRFVLQEPDSQVVLQRNDSYWGQRAQVERVRLTIVPDAP